MKKTVSTIAGLMMLMGTLTMTYNSIAAEPYQKGQIASGIEPVIGHYVNYTLHHDGLIGYHKVTYDSLVGSNEIRIIIEGEDLWGRFYNSSAIVDTTNRWIKSGDLYLWWVGVQVFYCPFWVETNIGEGSKIKLLDIFDATVTGSYLILCSSPCRNFEVDCWTLYRIDPFLLVSCHAWPDKASGLLIEMQYTEYTDVYRLTLAGTDMPIRHYKEGPSYTNDGAEYWLSDQRMRYVRLISHY